jgi:LacI family transcriptional regulator, galactose operon repressor
MSTIVEVAKRASVSIATVSNVIRGTKRVSPDLQERVRAAIRELDYSPNAIARGLKVKQTRMLGMVLPDITNPFFPGIIRGAEDTAFDRDYFLVTANTDEQIGRERRLLGALRSYRADGILLASAPGSDVSHIRRTIKSGVSVVFLDRLVAGVEGDAVLLDNVKGARECVRHLLQLGHRRIAIITGPHTLQNARERLQGYEEALRESDVNLDSALIFEGDYRLESGHRLAKQLLRDRSDASALFVCNGVMTVGVLNAFEEAGLHSPRDMSLATFDDLTLDPSSHSHLTAVVQPSYEMGSRAATLLMDRIEGRLTGDPIVLRVVPTLVIRDSTARHEVSKSGSSRILESRA